MISCALKIHFTMPDTLLIFIKNPRPGRVKTRLARTLGDVEALRIYRFLLEKTRRAALAVAAERWLLYSDEIEPDDEWPVPDFTKLVQEGADLGKRMARSFQQAFAAGASKAVIIGSDCPELKGDRIAEAFARLDAADFVLGPTTDGGYYLLGMKQPEPAVFQGVAWSTPAVLEQTLAIIRALGRSPALLPTLPDIDTGDDWRAYQQRC